MMTAAAAPTGLSVHEHVGDGSLSVSWGQPSVGCSTCFFTFLSLSF